MDKYDFYFKQAVSQLQFNAAFDAVEQATWNMFADQRIAGIVTGFVPSAPGSGWNLGVSAGLGVDKNGARLHSAGTITLDPRTDTAGLTCVPPAGNRLWVSVYAHFGRNPSGAQTDGVGNPILFNQPEALNPLAAAAASTPSVPYSAPANAGKLLVVQAAPDLISNPIPTRPSFDASAILICDILLTDGDTGLVAAKIDTARAERMGSGLTLWSPPASTEYQGGTIKFVSMSAVPLSGLVYARTFISSQGPCVTSNANWDEISQTWFADDATKRASRVTLTASGLVVVGKTDTTSNWLEGSGSSGWDTAYTLALGVTGTSVLEPAGGDTEILGGTQTIYWAMNGETMATGGGTVRGSAVAFPKVSPFGPPSSITVSSAGLPGDTNVNGCTFTIAPEGSGSSRWQPNGVMINVSTNGTPDVFNVRRNIIVVD